ncbi:DHH family putative phosphoesterase [Allofrancisella inopinata]|uniref:DHH family phosphoesterase n=1 Tax=Allofrancisella inopinata TaxID=1085647 RepID=A0AAE6YGN5_9GAMM|nr:DHH family phosphoesterase [Allofrancisella inopinata]QIV95575.1 DHH family phosphoesterase [Allofrancisella inopinata]TDT70736.1 DHH family putative phosphoesterase [Allofrancisella inopinata]
MHIDIFNGDADGILSLVQLRKAFSVEQSNQKLITGVKRDIDLCKKVSDLQAQGSEITVLDISFDKNVEDIKRLLQSAKQINYFDHHKADKLISHPKLNLKIDLTVDVCTALLVSESLNNEHHLWAIAAVYGDNLFQKAELEADKLNLSPKQKDQLKEFGILINYNGYGSSIDDLHYQPEDLYRELMKCDTPFEIIADKKSCFYVLKKGFEKDNENLEKLGIQELEYVNFVELPNEPWARRISGTLGNDLANRYRDKAIIVATQKENGNYLISLRAPKNNPKGASEICSQFSNGGGREAAAGVNDLLPSELTDFIKKVQSFYNY